MAAVTLGEFQDDSIVLHFGGATASIDADTFARSLLGFIETARAINAVVNPGQEIELRLEARGPGSYRAVVRRVKRDLGGFFSRGAEAVFWGIVATVIYEHVIKSDPHITVTINSNGATVEGGAESVFIPREIFDSAKNAEKDPAVRRGLRHTFEPLQQDQTVTEFGLIPRLTDTLPTIKVPREIFQSFIEPIVIEEELPSLERVREESARLVILKAWLNHGNRKWAFEWNGVPISAPIADVGFLDKLQRREFKLGAGDALDAVVTYRQVLDSKLGVHVNDQNSFVISEVKAVVPRD